MARRRSTVEYLEQLVEWAGGRGAFCKKTGVAAPNLSAYLNGSKPVSWKRLASSTRAVFGAAPTFAPLIELHNLQTDALPTKGVMGTSPGVYALFDSAMRLLYFGKATNLYAEVRQTLDRRVDHVRTLVKNEELTFRDVSTYLSAYRIEGGDRDYRHDVEALVLRIVRNTTFNKNFGKFKRPH